ncbi:hypothetical protein XU18_4937 [Perkinsela sp. CCAP 1560/4]|nr:hypothetical protein XU18_4937 [Perkinsela sp. CCAP 1560/4]|eukprot:KNH03742.1 hypothetical protein XU18_4937 [Perkinsela sp. CCAP 1560/4]
MRQLVLVHRVNIYDNHLTADSTEDHLWWVGSAPRREGSQEPSKLSSCFCFGADSIDGRRKVVGWISILLWRGLGDRRLFLWGISDPPGGETRERPLILCGLKRGMR